MDRITDAAGHDLASLPGWIAKYAERLRAATGNPEQLARLLRRSLVPIVMVDGERVYVEVNAPARVALGIVHTDFRRLRIDDLTPPYFWPQLEGLWRRLMDVGWATGDPSGGNGGYLGVSYYALANVLPGRHVLAFAPAVWPDADLISDLGELPPEHLNPGLLTARELEVLELAAEGHNAPAIAAELTLSTATIRTHFEHLYAKLAVQDRAAAVAKAIRLGLIS